LHLLVESALLLFSISCIKEAYATAQCGEVIFIDGKKYSMFSLPLDWNEEHLDSLLLDKYPYRTTCTALWRNYIGYWSINDNTLYLDSIQINVFDDEYCKTVIAKDEEILKPYLDQHGIAATWATGRLRIVSGKIIRYVHMGWESTYEHEKFLELREGKIIATTKYKNKKIVNGWLDGQNLKKIKKFQETIYEKHPTLTSKYSIKINHDSIDKRGNIIHTLIQIKGNSRNETFPELEKDIADYIVKKKGLSIYFIDGNYISEIYYVPLRFDKSHNN